MRLIKKIFLSKNFIPISFLMICIIFVFYQVIFLGKTLTTGIVSEGVMGTKKSINFEIAKEKEITNIIDRGGSAWQDEPQTIKVSNSYKENRLPLWNKNAGFGKPLAADMMSMAFSLFRVPIFINNSIVVFDLMLIFRIFCGGIFMYLFLKKIKISNLASAVGSVIYVLSGYFIYYANMGHLNVELLMPMLFYSIELIFEKINSRTFLLLVISIILMIVGGHPESLIISVLFSSIYLIQKLLFVKKRNIKKKEILNKYFLGIFFAVSILAFFLIPFLEYFVNSDIGLHNSTHKLYAISQSPRILILQFFPILIKSSLESSNNNYLSLIILFLSIVGLFNKKLKTTYRIFFVFQFFLLIKVYSNFLFNWIEYIPIFNNFVYYKYLQPEISFSFAVLATIGLEYLKNESKILKPFLLGFLTLIIVDLGLYFNISKMSFFSGRLHLLAAIIIPIFLLFVYIFIRTIENKILILKRYNFSFIFLCFISVIELIAFSPKNRPLRGDVYNEPNYVKFLEQDKTPYRIFSTDKIMYPATSSVFNIDDIRDLHAVYPRLYISYIKNFIDDSIVDRFSEYKPETKIFNNKFFNLTNTKYILSYRPLEFNIDQTLTKKIINQNELDDNTYLTWFNINKDSKIVLFEHPPAKIAYKFIPDEEESILNFSVGLDPNIWDPQYGEGVTFKIDVLVNNDTIEIYNEYVDPKNNVDHRKWFENTIDLSNFIDKEITLEFITSTHNSNAYAWAGWGDLKLFSNENQPDTTFGNQFTKIYSDEILIYENNQSLPRAFTVNNIIIVDNEGACTNEMKKEAFNPLETAIVIVNDNSLDEKELNNYLPGEIEYLYEDDNNFIINTMTDSDSYLVISNIFYPGWKAYIDNEEVELFQTNLSFNGMFLPKGEHKVVLKYSPISYKIGFVISSISFLYTIFYIYKKLSKK